MINDNWSKIAYTINISLGNNIGGGVKFVSDMQLKPGKQRWVKWNQSIGLRLHVT